MREGSSSALAQRTKEPQNARTRLLVAALRAAAQRVTGFSPQKARASLDLLARFAPPIFGVRRERAVVGGIPGEWFVPQGWRGEVTFLHLHGGGFALCSSITHRMMIAELARASTARGLCINYRLAPEHPFPAALDDCESAYHGLIRHGVHPERLVLTGDSAGGALALATLLRLREQDLPLPAATVLLSPWVDLTNPRVGGGDEQEPNDYLHESFMSFFAGLYLDGVDPANHFASPLYADLAGLPPLLVQAGGNELLLPDIERLARRAEEAAVEVTLQVWPSMVHAFQGFTFVLPEAREAIEAIGRFVRERTGLEQPRRSLAQHQP